MSGVVGDRGVSGSLCDEAGDGVLWDGGEVPGVDADVDLAVLLAPFLVDVAAEQPVPVVLEPLVCWAAARGRISWA